jgi:hypothetical protein
MNEQEYLDLVMTGTPPHCDPFVLHLPGNCEFCAGRTDLQTYRLVNKISHTDSEVVEEGFEPCPALQRRDKENIENWPGNRPENEQRKHERAEHFDRLDVFLKERGLGGRKP